MQKLNFPIYSFRFKNNENKVAIFDEIRNQPTGVGGEIQLTDAIARLKSREAVYAFQYEGKRYDCGSKEGFLEATVELALEHPQVGESFRKYLKSLSL